MKLLREQIALGLIRLACKIDAGPLFTAKWLIGNVTWPMADWSHDRELNYSSREYEVADKLISEWRGHLRLAEEQIQILMRPQKYKTLDHVKLVKNLVALLESLKS